MIACCYLVWFVWVRLGLSGSVRCVRRTILCLSTSFTFRFLLPGVSGSPLFSLDPALDLGPDGRGRCRGGRGQLSSGFAIKDNIREVRVAFSIVFQHCGRVCPFRWSTVIVGSSHRVPPSTQQSAVVLVGIVVRQALCCPKYIYTLDPSHVEAHVDAHAAIPLVWRVPGLARDCALCDGSPAELYAEFVATPAL